MDLKVKPGVTPAQTTTTPAPGRIDFGEGRMPPVDEGSDEGGLNPLLAILGLGAAGAAAHYGVKNPGVIADKLKKAGGFVGNLRMSSMLSGFAPLKSALGNLGAAGNVAMETKSLQPLKEMFSGATMDDFMRELKTPTSNFALDNSAEGASMASNSAWNPFGRVMNAGDTATRNALKRSGTTAKDAEAHVLQTPLPPQIASALDNPVMRYLIPFRRTPVNQALEGGRAFGRLASNPETRLPFAVHTGIGAATGATTSDEQYPITPAFTASLAGKYGIPSYIGAILARQMVGGKEDGGMVGGMMPTSEFGTKRALDPTHALDFIDPSKSAAYRALERFGR